MKRLVAFLAVALMAGTASASVNLNEIYASHTGTDNREFVELIGAGSLDNMAVLVVEGQASSAFGTLDRAWDLTGNTVPGDSYFVLADDGTPNQDFSIGTSNAIENGSETIYLVETANATDMATLVGLVGTDVDSDDDGLIFTDPDDYQSLATILDHITMLGSATDWVFDGSDARGPDGTFFPAGIYRGSDVVRDYPEDWANTFLNFSDPPPGTSSTRPTPGEQNIPEPASLAFLALGALAILRRR